MHILLIILILILLCGGLGAGPWWGYSGGWGYRPVGGIGLIIVILLVLLLVGAI